MPKRLRSFGASSLLVLLLACRGGDEESSTTVDSGMSAVAALACPDATAVDWAFECRDDVWSGFLWTGDGCVGDVVLDAWAPLHHERHELERVDVLAAAETWTLGPILTGVADWTPQTTSTWTCDEHGELTFALLVYGAEDLLSCDAWGPDAANVADLAGATVDHGGCAIR